MSTPPPDISLALQTIKRADVEAWPRLGTTLLHPTPHIAQDDAARLDELVAWSAGRTGGQRSFVEASVTNFARVLADLNLVLHYSMEVRGSHFWVLQWYRLFYESADHHADVEEWGIHVALIHNLTIELTRALNMIVSRTRQADPSLVEGVALAVVDTDPSHARMEPATYSAAEADAPQPYPGLRRLPAVLATRTVGGLGFDTYDSPRTCEQFDSWIDHLIGERGPASTAPAPAADIPFVLLRPVDGRQASSRLPPHLAAPYGVVLVFAAVAGLVAYPWLAGAALGSATATAVFHRRVWRWPPDTLRVVIVVAVGVVCGVAAEWLTAGTSTRPARPHYASPPPPQSHTTSTAVVPGQVEGGNGALGFANLTKRYGYRHSQLAGPCDVLEYRVRLYNPGPSDLASVRIAADINTITPYHKAIPTVVVYTPNGINGQTAYQDIITISPARTQAYIPLSAEILNSSGNVVRTSARNEMPDDITASGYGINIGSLTVGTTEFVQFRTHVACQLPHLPSP